MKITNTSIEGVFVVETTPFNDHRGSFARLFCNEELRTIMGNRQIKQINHSHTSLAGTVRGIHMQKPPFAEMKLVRCIKGCIFDIAVDLRQDSSTFKQWLGVELTAKNRKMFIIPEGCAHGFQTLEHQSEMLYLHSEIYHPDSEVGINPLAPSSDIKWPLKVTDLSPRDKDLPSIDSFLTGKHDEM